MVHMLSSFKKKILYFLLLFKSSVFANQSLQHHANAEGMTRLIQPKTVAQILVSNQIINPQAVLITSRTAGTK